MTEAQEVMAWIGKDKDNCWKDPIFVEKYMRALNYLAVPLIHRAKISNLIVRAKSGEFAFPARVISEGSGPSLLYDAYQSLSDIVRANGYDIPSIVDRDTSFVMLQRGSNPHKVVSCMTGINSPFKDESFDMVDNESISLLKNADEVKQSLLEANRILKPDGLIELIVKNIRFLDTFYEGMEDLGFAVLTRKNEGFAVSKKFQKLLKEQKGEQYANAYAAKLRDTYVLIATKTGAPVDVPSDAFWFERPHAEDDEENTAPAPTIKGAVETTPAHEPKERVKTGKGKSPRKKKEVHTRRVLPGEIPGLSDDLLGNAQIEE